MANTATRIAKASLASDFSKVRKASAVRRSLVVLAVAFIGMWLNGPTTAAHMVISALLVGMLDKGGSTRQVWQTMLAATVLLSVVTMVSGFLTGDSILLIALMGLLAFGAGASTGVNPRLPTLFVFSSITMASALIQPIAPGQELLAALGVAVAGLLQTVTTAAAAPVIGYLPERKKLAAAMSAVSIQFRMMSQDPHSAIAVENDVIAAMAAAEDTISSTDIASDTRRRYATELAIVDVLRREARGYVTRSQIGTTYPHDATTLQVFALVADALEHASRAEVSRHPEAEIDALDSSVAQLLELDQKAPTETSHLIIRTIAELPSEIRASQDDPKIYRSHRKRGQPLKGRLIASLSWGSIPFKHGIRMGLGAVVGMSLALALNLPQASWVAVTLIMVVRPDTGPTTTRALSRALGTVVGAVLVLVITWFTGSNEMMLIAAIAVCSLALYITMPMGYLWQTMFIAAVVLLAIALGGADPTQLTFYRLIDVFVGCIWGLILAFTFPIWTRDSLPREASNYCVAIADWMELVARAARLPFSERGELLDQANSQAKTARTARQSLSATLNTSLVEPPSKNIDVSAINNVMGLMRECTQKSVAAERILAHGSIVSEASVDQMDHTVREIRIAADQILLGSNSEVVECYFKPQKTPDDEFSKLVQESADSAHAAHQVVESKLMA